MDPKHALPKAPGNPESNALGPGVDQNLLEQAVGASGYPMQISVAERLTKQFDTVEHEWSYLDESSAKLRALDIHAMKRRLSGRDVHVYPELDLLVECKKSELPFVFFLVDKHVSSALHPRFGGISRQRAFLKTEYDNAVSRGTLFDTLGISDHPLIKPQHVCFTFSKATRSGKKIELSGSEAYNNIVMPLISSSKHFEMATKPRKTFQYFTLGMCFPLCVIDGPLVGVQHGKMQMIPWVRVYRHENIPSGEGPSYGEFRFLDIVHDGYLDAYVEKLALPLFNKFAQRAVEHESGIAERYGKVGAENQ